MTHAQQTASDPSHSVWVAANAGTGKTKVLTDRVLRLLLRGVFSSRILCITYTKAAAAEMQNRIHQTLETWVTLDDARLHTALHRLTDESPQPEILQRARRLFAEVLDAPDGVRIQTIHGFCQSILRRFPLEAGIEPHFEVIDERMAGELLIEARQRLFCKSQSDPKLERAIHILLRRLDEGRFYALLQQLISDRRHFGNALKKPGGMDDFVRRMYAALQAPQDLDEAGLFAQYVQNNEGNEILHRRTYQLMQDEGSKTDKERAEKWARWWQAEKKQDAWEDYRAIWLKKDGELFAYDKLMTKKLRDTYPDLHKAMVAEQGRVFAFTERLNALRCACYSESAVILVEALLEHYNHLKAMQQFLDYEDLIFYTLRLLDQSSMAAWVMYKLDGGIDHVLLDEAQDTSLEQWLLVERLTEEFFAGQGRRVHDASLFVVGDEKQSIYRFQGADPEKFLDMRHAFEQKAKMAEKPFAKVPLLLSFRSTESVLKAVDSVFPSEENQHIAHRTGQAGRVELWALLTQDKQEKHEISLQDAQIASKDETSRLMAQRIALLVQSWLASGERLESQNRPIHAGDILILVRSRSALMQHMVHELKNVNVPVAGIDRMRIKDSIAVMDLLALAEFLLLPDDDLNLACVLKSPLFGIEEEVLFTLCHNRAKHNLWQQLQARPELGQVVDYLTQLLNMADYVRPFELFSTVLDSCGGRKAFAVRLGVEAIEPLSEFLSLALEYERDHTPNLQGFLHWLNASDAQIKRDMEQKMNAVRIMTVHGAKGLQAPIVFLPDTMPSSAKDSGIFWTKEENKPLFLFSPAKTEDAACVAHLRQMAEEEEIKESRRLLYVAMTRAEDRLYIGGFLPAGYKNASERSWYHWVHAALTPLAQKDEETKMLFLENPQTIPAKIKTDVFLPKPFLALPDFLLHPPAPEPYPSQPLTPSSSEEFAPEETTFSPVVDQERFVRGNAIHRLLQFLPDVEETVREQKALRYLSHYAASFSADARQEMVCEVLGVLSHLDMAPVFGEGSRAEVPLSGVVELGGKSRIVHGRVDRLRINAQGIWIIDYKTGRMPPKDINAIPAAYTTQMGVYCALLKAIYPDVAVTTALLWTITPCLMVLPESALVFSGSSDVEAISH